MLIEISECPVCSGHSFTKTLICQDFTVSHETFSIVKCDQCQLLITSPRPADGELGKYYFSEEYISHSSESKNITDKVYRLARHFTLNWKLRLVKKNSFRKAKLKLLDYGCGTGDFLQKCKDDGHDVYGVEPSDKARGTATSLTGAHITSSINELQENSFDAITLWHVLEHVPNPNKTLSQLIAKLNENGTMFIAVPNHKSNDAQHYGPHWAAYDVPRHLWHFSQHNMKLLATKNKLTQVNILPMKLDAFYVSLMSEKYKAGKQTFSTLIKGFFRGLLSNRKATQDNDYSSLIYIFRK
jgi:2-polyprenyl-3-methyl-5-hydroxy-6-metoxy-1,4-benzoquinol methylase